MKAYPEYKASGIDWLGDIPSSWKIVPSRWSAKFTYGFSADSRLFSNEKKGIPLIRIRDINSEDTEIYYKGTDYPKDAIIHNGDLLIGMDGDFNIAKWKGRDAILNQRVCKFNEGNGILRDFIFYLMPIILNDINCTKYPTTVKHLSASDLAEMLLPIPPIKEQEAIATYLNEKTERIDALVMEKQVQIEDLRIYRTSLITETVTRGLAIDGKFKSTSSIWYPKIPYNWKISKFKYEAKVKTNLVSPKEYLDYPQIGPDSIEKDTGRLVGNYRTVKDAGIISNNHLFFKGQIIYSKIRPNLNKIIVAPFDGLCSADMYPIETKNNINYLKYLMLSSVFVNQVSRTIQGRVCIPRINQEELGEIILVIPPISEQQQIVEYLDKKIKKIDMLIDEVTKQLDELALYRKSIISETVTGKVDVRYWKPEN